MKLPPKSDGTYISLPPSKRQVTIIGANGSGKTRFTEYLRRNESSPTFNLSALEALCTTSHDDADPCSIDSLYARSMAKANFLHNDADTMFERLMVLLLNEEMVRLVEYKVSHARGENPPLTETKLDAVISHWQEIFPENHVLREGADCCSGASATRAVMHRADFLRERRRFSTISELCFTRLTMLRSLLTIPACSCITPCCADCGMRLRP